MPTPEELEDKFWKALKSRPMTAQLDGDHGPIWMLFGADPKKDYRDNAAKVDLA